MTIAVDWGRKANNTKEQKKKKRDTCIKGLVWTPLEPKN